jgi:glycosyltransferase involved in cell wall biosynthesis
LRRLHLVPRKRLLIAPRGEFSTGALGIKPFKKRAWILIAAGFGLHRDALWQATTVEEARQIEDVMGDSSDVLLGPVLARSPEIEGPAFSGRRTPKTPGTARVVFFSRISPMKNLGFAISLIGDSPGRLLFDIYGVIDDKSYWAHCSRLISASSDGNVSISYRGELPHDDVASTLSDYDLLLLPSRGENFGHVILESLASGCPVAISDKTPWDDVQSAGAGWVIPLTDEDRWRAAVENIVNADEETHRRIRSAAVKLARLRSSRGADVDQNRQLFYTAARRHPASDSRKRRSRAAGSVEPHLKDDQTPNP